MDEQTREQAVPSDAADAQPAAHSDSAEIGSHLSDEERDLLRSFPTSAVLRGARHATDGDVESTVAIVEDLNQIPAEMQRFFVVETREDIEDIQRMVLEFEEHPAERSMLSEMGRLVHKIKGASATLGFDALASLALIFEDVIRALQSRAIDTIDTSPDATGSLGGLLALLETALEDATRQNSEPAAIDLTEQAEALRDGLLFQLSSAAGSQSSRIPETVADSPDTSGSVATGSGGTASDAGDLHARAGDVESFLRVEVGRLDKLMTHVNALVLNRASFVQLRDDIVRLQTELEQALKRLRTISQRITDRPQHELPVPLAGGRSEQHSISARSLMSNRVWEDLELERFTELDQALRQLTEVVADTSSATRFIRTALNRLDQIGDEQASITHEIQRDVIQIRLVRLEDLMPRMQLEARRLAASLGKSVTFTVRGQMTEIDRNISEALAEPLIQLVRNAVVHGIEPREERVDKGKPESGNIWIHAYYVGSEVVIEVGDDGRGVNPYRLAISAVAMGILNADSARKMPLSEALDMMFLPGITSFREAQMVAGRGIGLDEVRTAIGRLKGTIQVRSEVGKGSVFRIRVPISLSIVRALNVEIAGQPFAVPFSAVLQMTSVAQGNWSPPVSDVDSGARNSAGRSGKQIRVRVRAASEPQPAASPHRDIDIDIDIDAVGTPEEVAYEEIPALRLADLLGLEAPVPATQLALIVEVGRRRAALLVDAVADDEEIVVQTLPPHLRRRAIRGASVTPDGVVQLLLDLPELLQGVLDGGEKRPAMHKKHAARFTSDAPTVLVVDDSMSIRGALELALSRAGFDVSLARDGIEAFEMMLMSVPQVVVLDIEMPRLDGFELLAVMRETPQLAEVRVVMLTSRAAEKHREQAMRLGASAYLIKPCPQETLVETVRAQLISPRYLNPGTL